MPELLYADHEATTGSVSANLASATQDVETILVPLAKVPAGWAAEVPNTVPEDVYSVRYTGTIGEAPNAVALNSYDETLLDTRVIANTAPSLAEITSVVESARDAVLTEGAINWLTATGFSVIEPDNTGIGLITALISGGSFTTAALQNAPTGSGDGSGLTPQQNTQLDTLFNLVDGAGDSFTAIALANAPSGGGAGGGLLADERTRLFEIPTAPLLAADYENPPELGDITSAITGAQNTILNVGNAAWATATGFATDAGLSTVANSVVSLADIQAALTATENSLTAIGNAAWGTADLAAIDTALAQIQTATDRLTAARAAALDQPLSTFNPSTDTVTASNVVGAVDVNAIAGTTVTGPDDFKATGFTTPADLAGLDATTSTAVVAALEAQLTRIEVDSTGARQALTNNSHVDLNLNTATIYADDGVTPLFVWDLSPSAQTSTTRKLSLNTLPATP